MINAFRTILGLGSAPGETDEPPESVYISKAEERAQIAADYAEAAANRRPVEQAKKRKAREAARVAREARVARVARVAREARVARVARVSREARVAREANAKARENDLYEQLKKAEDKNNELTASVNKERTKRRQSELINTVLLSAINSDTSPAPDIWEDALDTR